MRHLLFVSNVGTFAVTCRVPILQANPVFRQHPDGKPNRTKTTKHILSISPRSQISTCAACGRPTGLSNVGDVQCLSTLRCLVEFRGVSARYTRRAPNVTRQQEAILLHQRRSRSLERGPNRCLGSAFDGTFYWAATSRELRRQKRRDEDRGKRRALRNRSKYGHKPMHWVYLGPL